MRTLFHIAVILLWLFLRRAIGQTTIVPTTTTPWIPATPTGDVNDLGNNVDATNVIDGNENTLGETANSSTPNPTTAQPELEQEEDIFEEVCSKPAVITGYCELPDELKNFLPSNATLNDIGYYLLSKTVIDDLLSQCPPGSWCLSSDSSTKEIADKVAFWTNSSDFDMTCWPDLGECLHYIADYYYECDSFEVLNLIAQMEDLLCKMKVEPMASPECIEQTIKSLHVSMADTMRPFEEMEKSETGPECETRAAMMTKNFLCTTSMCETYSAVLYEFPAWAWFRESIDELKASCQVEDMACLEKAEEESFNEIISTLLEDESKVHQTNWLLEQMDLRTIIVIAVLSVSGICAITLIMFLVWRRRKLKVRVRDGMEYMEIKPEETEAFLESSMEIGDDTKLIANCKDF